MMQLAFPLLGRTLLFSLHLTSTPANTPASKHLYNLHTARSSTTTTPNTRSLDRVDILVQPPPPPRRPTKIDNPFYHLMDPQPQLHFPQDHHPWHSIPACCPLYLRDHMSRRGHQGHCKTRGCTGCCPCVSCPLWAQLKGWMPRDLKYCVTCHKFTLRNKKKYKGRCALLRSFLALCDMLTKARLPHPANQTKSRV